MNHVGSSFHSVGFLTARTLFVAETLEEMGTIVALWYRNLSSLIRDHTHNPPVLQGRFLITRLPENSRGKVLMRVRRKRKEGRKCG